MTQPTKVVCVSFSINGTQLANFINTINIYENICKAYRTASVAVIDNNNIINTLQLKGGETVSFNVQSDGGGSYSATMKLLKILKQKPNVSLRTNIYQLELIDNEYFGDRSNLVQRAFKSMQGTSAIQQIHQQFIGSALSILAPSTGLLWNKNSHVINALKPFTAIDNIRKMLTFAQYPSGVSVYYHDNQGVKLAPLEQLFDTMSAGQQFVQKATWGSNWTDIFTATNAIITAETSYENNPNTTSIVDTSAAAQSARKVLDMYSNKRAISDMMSAVSLPGISSLGGLLSMFSSVSTGGLHSFVATDSQKIPNENVRDASKQNAFNAAVGNAPHLIIKVPCQTGFNVTVGQGFSAKMIPPAGDAINASDPMNSGNYLAIRIVHSLHFDESDLQGTSSIEGVKLS